LHVDIDGAANTEVTIRIMDMLGQLQMEEKFVYGTGSSSKELDLGKLANGLYIVNLTKGDQSYSHKITIHK